MLLEVKNYSLGFVQYTAGLNRRNFTVLREMNLAVAPGEIVAVFGASGSGKSLLAHGILGILPENAWSTGEIYLDGARLEGERLKKARGREMALIPQSVDFLDPLMKVGRQVAGAARGAGRRERERRAEAVLARYGLSPAVMDMYPFELSGGMARRVLAASAFLSGAKLIVADEPTTGLHEAAIREEMRHLAELAEDGAGVLLITHDITAALQCAHRVAVLYAGTIVEVARRAAFAGEGEALRHPYARALWRALPMNAFKGLPGTQPSHLAPEAGCPFAPRCPLKGERCGEMPPVTVWEGGEFRCWGKPPPGNSRAECED